MRYLGGKEHTAKHLVPRMLEYADNCDTYIEPFVGGGSIVKHMAPHFTCSIAIDIVPDLILLYKAIQNNENLPEVITEDMYYTLKNEDPSALRGLAGFGGSFGGKWFGGYARGNKPNGQPRNYVAETLRNLRKMIPNIANVNFICDTYTNYTFSKGQLVYCDPPFQGTTQFDGADEFDWGFFWKWVNECRKNGAEVFVSEYSIPDHVGHEILWEKIKRSTVALANRDNLRHEKLYRIL